MRDATAPTKRRLAIVLGLTVVGLIIPSSAQGQATRTWVSGVGDDANPCSRTAPCKTFAGAISKTAPAGEINCLDPGGFGGVTITKSISIICKGTIGGVLAAGAGVNAIVVNAGPTDRVFLKGLDVNGAGTAQDGIRFIAGKKLKITDSEIHGFKASTTTSEGVFMGSTTNGARMTIQDTVIYNNGARGVLVQPGTAVLNRAVVRNSDIDDNNRGVVAVSAGGATAVADVFNTSIIDNALVGVAVGGPNAAVRLSNNDIIDNATPSCAASCGISFDAGTGAQIISFGNNRIAGNGNGTPAAQGSPTSTISQTRGR